MTTSSKTITKVIQGTRSVVNAEVAFFSNVKSRADTYMNYTRPPLAIGLEPIKKAFLDAKNRGVYLRYITEITNENLTYCKELIKVVHELRHLDGINGNYMVSESEYIAPLILFEHGKVASQAVYSNIREVVEQQQYVFDNLWNRAIPFEERIKEIEEGRTNHYETKVLTDKGEISEKIEHFLENSNEVLSCSGSGGLRLGYDKFLDLGKEIMARSRRGEHKGIKLLTAPLNKDTVELVKVLMDSGIEVREIKNMPPMSFSITDKEVHATIDKMESRELAQSVLVSNEPVYVNHFRSIFEELWKDGIDPKTRLSSIEEGADFGEIKVIPNASRAAELYLDLERNAQKEIIIMYPTPNAFLRQYRLGAAQLAKEAAHKRDVKVRILMPKHQSTEEFVQSFTNKEEQEKNSAASNSDLIHDNIDVRYIEQAMLDTHATILVVDKKISLVMEIRDDSKTTFNEAIGLSTYSDSKAGVLSYLSLVENLWVQTELYQQIKDSNTKLEIANERLEAANEQLKLHDKMQQDFINIAAHELRTPIQPILGLSQILRTKSRDTQTIDSLNIVIRNAVRLQHLTEDILDVQKIEGNTLQLNKENLDLNALISNLVDDYRSQQEREKKEDSPALSLWYDLDRSKPIFVEADRDRLVRVIHNLLDNSVKFTKEGAIVVMVREEGGQQQPDKVIIIVKDTGKGIDLDILPRLFSKFVTKSYQGTGLGLYICKGIIEAHGGKIWAENNPDGKGARFSFSIPIVTQISPRN
jgi:signal transduction histidine kinase